VVTLAQILVKSVVLDIVVTEIPPKFGTLLSRSCCAKLGESLQMDMYYATILVYGGEHLWLYREVIFMNIICRDDRARNHPIYAVDQHFGCFELSVNNSQNTQLTIDDVVDQPKTIEIDIWKMYFDGSCSKEGVEAEIVLISPDKENITQSYKLEFDVTNNVVEYEAFMLGLELARSLKVKNLSVYSDSKLIVRQVRN